MQPMPAYELPRDGNHVPAAGGVYSASTPSITAGNVYALQLDSSGNLLVNIAAGGGGGGGGNVNLTQVNGTSISLGQTTASASLPVVNASSTVLTGQATANGSTPVQVTSTSKVLVNGIVVKAPSTNSPTDLLYVGLTGVTTSTGDLLEPGERVGYPAANANLLYIVCTSSTTNKVTFEAS
jgi:archaellum component FlaF (FlaF/FlaG flagellin family)